MLRGVKRRNAAICVPLGQGPCPGPDSHLWATCFVRKSQSHSVKLDAHVLYAVFETLSWVP